MSPIPDLKLNTDALDDARIRLAAASVPVIGPPTPGDEVLASGTVSAALSEIEPVLLLSRTSLAVAMAEISNGISDISETFAAVDVQLAGGLS